MDASRPGGAYSNLGVMPPKSGCIIWRVVCGEVEACDAPTAYGQGSARPVRARRLVVPAGAAHRHAGRACVEGVVASKTPRTTPRSAPPRRARSHTLRTPEVSLGSGGIGIGTLAGGHLLILLEWETTSCCCPGGRSVLRRL